MAALDRLKQGMQNPEGQTMREMRWSDYPVGQETPEAFWSRGKQRDVEAVPFGSLADPVSQLALLLAPEILPALKGLRASGPMPRGSVLGNQRGAVGGDPLRGPEGEMSLAEWQRLLRQRQGEQFKRGGSRVTEQKPAPGGLAEGRQLAAEEQRRMREQALPGRPGLPADSESLDYLGRTGPVPQTPGSPAFLYDLYKRLGQKAAMSPQEKAMYHRLRYWIERDQSGF